MHGYQRDFKFQFELRKGKQLTESTLEKNFNNQGTLREVILCEDLKKILFSQFRSILP